MNTGFQRKHVLVTGASSGIGFQSISLFLAEGAWVTACYKSNPSNLETLKDSYSERLNVVKVDVRNDSEVASLFSEANAVFGRVDASVVNAGIAFADGVTVYEMSMKRGKSDWGISLCKIFLY
ncbi:MAG: SDR family NAD(P)-dependent oxidoreductase [Deltaproteobacteria bacterium]|nr:SDR family NAD(P)-dependent oxidoreductase [Deltaproteobacteria bacterium]